MKVNDLLHGFRVLKATDVCEIGATLFEMEHEKTGAKLHFLKREDENKTFAITFKTIPEDSTGVFHIIEHSVLCGSEKYTVKEPFVELLKGSLNTFLNAMTFPDKTMYPVASRNDKDFLNLVSVYMDAVLHPAILKNPNIFRQEGWHYEINEESGEMTRSGVVLNEMRGAFSSPDEVATYHLKDMLYPDTCYKYESGGKPNFITDLTYENFLNAHKKYYHPSNSIIFLDGSVNLDTVLPLINSYLEDYERQPIDFDICDQPPINAGKREVEYEIAPNETKENKTRLEVGYVFARFDEQEKIVAANVLFDAICSTNESPLKKALIDSGLCEDVSVIPYDSLKQSALLLDFRNVKDGKCDELFDLFIDTVKDLAAQGIDRTMLEAALNSHEFKTREKDFGTLPLGIINAMATLETSLYGGNPVQNLSFGETYASLREKLSTDYFEKLLLALLVENEHRGVVVMKPSSTLGEESAKAETELLKKIKEEMTDGEIEQIKKICLDLQNWQKTPDSPEDLATIPALSVSDISAEVEKIPETQDTLDGVTVLYHPVATNGILYTDLYFDVSDLTKEEIFDLRILLSLIENVKTESHSAIELQNIIKRELGSFSATMNAVTNNKKAKIYVNVSASALESKKDFLPEILKEILYTSVYTDKETARNVVRQMKMASDESFISGGHSAGFQRASAFVDTEAAIMEYFSGYEAHVSTKALEKDFDKLFPALSERVTTLAKRIFTRERLLLSFTGEPNESFTKTLIYAIECGENYDPVCKIKPLGVRREGIVIPAQASYAEMAANIFEFGEKPTGSMNVVRSLLSYGYLWNVVRVQGGAYGCGLIARNNGNVGFYSFRDPTPARTISCYKESANFLREFANSGEDITKFIIGAVGDTSPLTTPKLKGTLKTARYLRGITYEDECKSRKQILDTDAAELNRIADLLDKVCETGAVCIIAGKDKIDTCAEIIDTVLEI